MDINSFKDICITSDVSIKKTVDVLNAGHKRIVLVVEKQKLIGVVSDSDIRRAILKNIPFTRPVSDIMVTTPVVATPDMTDHSILFLMKKTQVYQIPVTDYDGKILGLKLIDDLLRVPTRAEAFIFAGGLGTRLRPLTRKTPKPLINVGGNVLLLTLLDSLVSAGIKRITIALNYKRSMIKKAVNKSDKYRDKIVFVEEKEKLGTAGALSLFRSPLAVPLIVINADILTKVDYTSMLNFHHFENNIVTVAVRAEKVAMPFGVSTIQGTQIVKIEEKPEFTYFVNAGIYILSPIVLKLVSKRRKLDMPQLLMSCIQQNHRVGSFPVHEYWIDIGRPKDLAQAKTEFRHYFPNTKLK